MVEQHRRNKAYFDSWRARRQVDLLLDDRGIKFNGVRLDSMTACHGHDEVLPVAEETITGFYQANGRCKPPPRPGRTPLTDARRIVRAVKVNRFVSVAVVAARVTSDIGVNVSPEVVRARVRAAGLHGRSARKKPFLTRKHRRHRLRYAQEFLDWSEEK
ncbi:hypothetical protein PC119_g25045 [Phytophthora cactorum]|nr:hypothetical protein PC119_g25045 [Phytophthora cactorum]KAG3142216.1 hypothetical protein PC128_g24825 [Phytophthora cactorum]